MERTLWTFCSTMRIVTPWVRLISTIFANMSSRTLGDRPRDGSSNMRSFGFDTRARAIATICCSPPDKVHAICLRRSVSCGKVSRTAFTRAATSLAGRCMQPRSRFSRTESSPKTRFPWGQKVMPSLTLWAGLALLRAEPLNVADPFQSGRRPWTTFRTVDLPAPFGPMIAVIFPALAARSTPKSTCFLPYPVSATVSFSMSGVSVKVCLDYARITQNFVGGAFTDLLTGIHEDHAVHDTLQCFNVVFYDNDRFPLVR